MRIPSFMTWEILKKMVFDDDTLLLVAEDTESKRVLGTASIIFDIGAYGDLVGEFGRLVVHPDGAKQRYRPGIDAGPTRTG